MLAIESILSRSWPTPLATSGLVLGTLGIAALVGLHFGAIPIVPAAIVLFGSFTWALGSVYARYGAHGDSNPLFPAIEMVLGGLMQIVIGVILGEAAHVHLSNISHESLLGFLWLIGPGAIVGYSAYGYAVRTLPTHITATYAYVNPVVAVILGATLLGEAVTPNVIIGGTVVVLSVIAILMSRQRQTDRAT
jgi:drug/metabolite transporter (DMT)-like permease